MSRPKIAPGQLAAVEYTILAGGRVRARSRVRDDAGVLHPVKRVADTAEEALALLERRAAELSTGFEQLVTAASTIAQASAVWLEQLAAYGTVEGSTYDSYESTVRLIVVPTCGGVALRDLSVGRADRIIQRILAERGTSAARKARSVLSLVCGFVVRQDVIDRNPVRDVQRLPRSPKKESFLTPEQIEVVRMLMRAWRRGASPGPRPNAQLLEDGMDIMLGTSARIGEVVALERGDRDVTGATPAVRIAATEATSRATGRTRKNAPKRTRQKRLIAVPSYTAAAIRRRLAQTGSGPHAPLFATRTGKAYSVSNYERLLRGFVADNDNALREAGIVVEEFTTHLFRRTVATLVEQAAGITLASRLLGHASEATTRASYVVTPERVDPVTATILDTALGIERG